MLKRILEYIDNKKILLRTGRINWRQIVIWLALGILALLATSIIVLIILIALVSIGLPDVHDLDKLNVAQSTTIYDREGNILYVKHGGENREYITFENISKNIINATIAIEDDQFWNHSGFDPVGILRAAITDITHMGARQGGSTITQQYIKNTFLSSEKSYIRKLKELILAVQLERAYSKEKILELYLNKIPYGNNAYGIEKAAQIYFNKHAKDLDLAESSILASLPKAPGYYNPYGEHLYSTLTLAADSPRRKVINTESDLKDNEFLRGLIGKNIPLGENKFIYVQGRTDIVLKTMEKLGYITDEQKKDALAKLQTIQFNKYHEQIAHPHFVFRVISELEEKYGHELVEQGGLKVYTTLDPNLQSAAEKAVSEGAKRNESKYNAKNAALVAIDPRTGELLAMVGSRDYFDTAIDGAVNVADQYRQPGSAFKPFVYAQAFYNRYAPASVVFDTETRLGNSAFPKNFDGKFWGPMPMRKALGQSRNIPAIKTYFLAGEQEPIKELAERMGIVFMDRNRDYGWPLALGAAEVRLTDLVGAYGVFANNGVKLKTIDILKVENASGEVLEEHKPENDKGQEVLDPQIAYLINSILSDTSVRLSENMTVPGQINAAKSGTSNRKNGNQYYPHDLWCIGYTTRLAAGVWTGNNRDDEGNISIYADGVNVAAPIWKQFMTEALKNTPSEPFPTPEGIRQVTISTATGKLPGPNTPSNQQKTEIFASFSVPTEIDDSWSQAQVDTRNNKLANQYCPPAFVTTRSFLNLHDIAPIPEWEAGAQAWIKDHQEQFAHPPNTEGNNPNNPSETGNIGSTNIIYGPPPTEESELCNAQSFNSKPEITIISPKSSDIITTGSSVRVQVKVNAPNGMDKVEFYLDNRMTYYADQFPFDGTVRLPKVEIGSRRHIITAKAIDKLGYENSAQIEITTADSTSTTSIPSSGSSNNKPNDATTPPPDSSST
jgi:membrane peptidoglycan carboxypeptidase